MLQEYLNDDESIIFFEIPQNKISSNSYTMSALKLSVKEFFVNNRHILIYNNYFYILELKNNTYRIKKVIKRHIVLFLIKINKLTRSSRLIIYNIILTLYKQKTKKLYTVLEKIIEWLDIENLKSMKIKHEYLQIKRHNNDIEYYDNKLNKIDEVIKKAKVPKKYKIKVNRNNVAIKNTESSFDEIIHLKKLKQSQIIENKLYLLSKNQLHVINFY